MTLRKPCTGSGASEVPINGRDEGSERSLEVEDSDYRSLPMKEIISFLLKNFSLTFLCIGLLVSAVSLLRRPKPVSKTVVADKLLADYILYAVGFMYLYNFVVHTVFAETSAAFIGWANSPFQYEVGTRAWVSE
jgi:hypothetical protein